MRRLAAVVALTLIVAACSDDGGDAEPAPAPSSTTTTVSTTTTSATTTTDATPAEEAVVIDGADDVLRHVGRWEPNGDGDPTVRWAGASFSIRFHGTRVTAGITTTGPELISVVIDGEYSPLQRSALDGRGRVGTVDPLDEGWHTIEFVKETQFSTLTLHDVEITGSGEYEATAMPSRRIVFYGDSNLAGHSLMSERDEAAPLLYGTYTGYAGIVSRMFGADFHNLSWSGSRIAQVEAVFDAHDRDFPEDRWDLDRFPADVVVMNLGANDIYGPTKDDIIADYLSMLATLRAGHPDAHVVVYNAFGWSPVEPANYTAELLDLWDDDNVSVATFPWVFEQFHGTEYDHGGMAMVLADHLEQVMGWEAAEQDVMSGFGRDGDVANGSFEQVAPFGGWGWRYFDDPGVARRVGDGTAHDGEAYVELTDGAAVHQPTPIGPGRTVTVTGMARVDDVATLRVDLDFRDQTIYSAPLVVVPTEVELAPADDGDGWVPFTASATAPADLDIWHTRVTFTAVGDSTVALDSIEQTIG